MPSLRSLIDRSGRSLAYHIDRLQARLDELRERLRDAASQMLSETVADVVRQVLRSLLSVPRLEFLADSTPPEPIQDVPYWHRPAAYESMYDPAAMYADEDLEQFTPPPPEPQTAPETPRVSRWRTALAVGLRAASWWLERQTGRSAVAVALGLGATATAVVLAGGPLTLAGAGLAASALGLAGLPSLIATVMSVTVPPMS
jgi:hypothetical protein